MSGVRSGLAVSHWSLHIVSIQRHGWNLRCSAHTAVHCKWWQYSHHTSSLERRTLSVCLLTATWRWFYLL